jgi:hypothetical protein
LLHEDDNKKSDKKKRGRNHKKSKKHDNNGDDKAEKGDRKPSAKPKCPICGKIGHREDNCWSSEKNAKNREAASQSANPILKKSKYSTTTSSATTAALFTEEQVSVMMKNVMASLKEKYGGDKKPKQQVHFSDSDSDSNSSSDKKSNNKKDIPYSLAYYTYLFNRTRIMEAPMHQRQNVARYSAEIIVDILDLTNNVIPIRARLDTGTSETIILKSYLSPNTIRGYKGTPVK